MRNVFLGSENLDGLADLPRSKIDLTVVGPETPLRDCGPLQITGFKVFEPMQKQHV